MGQGTTRLEMADGTAAHVRRLGHETEIVRRELDGLVMELDRRRHLALDWRLQARRHARALALVAGGLVAALGLGLVRARSRHRRRRLLTERLTERAIPQCSGWRLDAPAAAGLAIDVARAVLPLVIDALREGGRTTGAREARTPKEDRHAPDHSRSDDRESENTGFRRYRDGGGAGDARPRDR